MMNFSLHLRVPRPCRFVLLHLTELATGFEKHSSNFSVSYIFPLSIFHLFSQSEPTIFLFMLLSLVAVATGNIHVFFHWLLCQTTLNKHFVALYFECPCQPHCFQQQGRWIYLAWNNSSICVLAVGFYFYMYALCNDLIRQFLFFSKITIQHSNIYFIMWLGFFLLLLSFSC